MSRVRATVTVFIGLYKGGREAEGGREGGRGREGREGGRGRRNGSGRGRVRVCERERERERERGGWGQSRAVVTLRGNLYLGNGGPIVNVVCGQQNIHIHMQSFRLNALFCQRLW